MRFDTQDQLTAIARFLDAAWRLSAPVLGRQGVERVRAAFGMYATAPSEATWSAMADVLTEVIGEPAARALLSDLEPYVR